MPGAGPAPDVEHRLTSDWSGGELAFARWGPNCPLGQMGGTEQMARRKARGRMAERDTAERPGRIAKL